MTTNNNINNFNQTSATSAASSSVPRRRCSIEFLEEFSTFATNVGLDNGRANAFTQSQRGQEESRKRKEFEGLNQHQHDVNNNNNKLIEVRNTKKLADSSLRVYGNRNLINRPNPITSTSARIIEEPLSSAKQQQQSKTMLLFPQPITSTAGTGITTAHGSGSSISGQKVYLVSADEKTYALLLASNASNSSMTTTSSVISTATTSSGLISSTSSTMFNTQAIDSSHETLKRTGNIIRPVVSVCWILFLKLTNMIIILGSLHAIRLPLEAGHFYADSR